MTLGLQDPRCLALGWAIVHSLWQGAVLGLMTAGALTLVRSSQARYLAACLGLMACWILPVITLVWLWPAAQGPLALPQGGVASATQSALGAGGVALVSRSRLGLVLAPCLPWAVMIWLAGVSLGGVRMAGAWLWLHRRAAGATAWVPEPVVARTREMARMLGIRRQVTLKSTGSLDGPLTHGWWRPVILVPAALLTGFPPAHVEALLAHELAHVARHDFLVNLVQCCVEVLLFYHPVAWWLSRRIRTEREHLCDDLAAQVLGDPMRLARALNALDDVQTRRQTLALAARGGHLVNRIRNLVSPLATAAPRPWAVATYLMLLPSLAVAGVALAHTLEASPSTHTQVQGHVEREASGAWTLHLTASKAGPMGKVVFLVEPLSPGAGHDTSSQGRMYITDFAATGSHPSGHGSRVAAKVPLDLDPAAVGMKVTLQEGEGETGQIIVPSGTRNFKWGLHAQNPAQEHGWVVGSLDRVPDHPDQLLVKVQAFVANVDLELATLEGHRLGTVKVGSQGAAGPRARHFSCPNMRIAAPEGADAVVLTLRDPANDEACRVELPVGKVFRAELGGGKRS